MKHPIINPYVKIFLNPWHRARFSKGGILEFHRFNIETIHKMPQLKDASFWEKIGQNMALSLFHAAAEHVPAYKDFLKRHSIDHARIRTIKDFATHVPLVDKNNYLIKYSIEDLCWDGKIEHNTLFSVSSGSSGRPFFWPRGDNLEIETSIIHGLILKEIFHADQYSTLVVNSFSMGIYIAGVITLNSVLRVTESGLPITIMTPGVELEDVLRVIKELGPHYNQVIISGYPPFVKDIIDRGEKGGVTWDTLHVKFLFAAENFSEAFRDYIFEKAGVSEILHSSVNIYGSADAGILGHETPFSIWIRRQAWKDEALFTRLFGDLTYLPTFVQYNPLFKYFETVDGELVFSTYGGIPLVRYNIHDAGNIIGFQDMLAIHHIKESKEGITLQKESWQLPFLFVKGKSDLTISFYGLKIYPENIKIGLENESLVPFVSGKFVMEQKNRRNQDQYWELAIELKEGVKPTYALEKQVKQVILQSLRKRNLEYNRLSAAIGNKAEPIIKLIPKGDVTYFDTKSVKQRWAKK